jgi:hypothetical protein
LIPRNVLSLDVLVGTSDPVLALLRLIGELNLEILFILRRWAAVNSSLGMRDWSAAGHQGTVLVVGWLARLIDNDAVCFSSGLTENLHLFGDVASVAWEVLLLVIDFLCHILLI